MIPMELQAAPPRDLRAAEGFVKRNNATIRGMFVGAGVLPPLVLAGMAWKFGEIDGLGIGLAAGIGGLVALFGVAMCVLEDDPRRFAVHTPGLGLVPGCARVLLDVPLDAAEPPP